LSAQPPAQHWHVPRTCPRDLRTDRSRDREPAVDGWPGRFRAGHDARHRHARAGRGPRRGAADGYQRQPGDSPRLCPWRDAGSRLGRDARPVLRADPVHAGIPARPTCLHGRRARRHRQHPRGHGRRLADRPARVVHDRLHLRQVGGRDRFRRPHHCADHQADRPVRRTGGGADVTAEELLWTMLLIFLGLAGARLLGYRFFSEDPRFTIWLNRVDRVPYWDYAGGPSGILRIPFPEAFGYVFQSQCDFLLVGLGLLAIAMILAQHLEHSRLGRGWIAIREDEFAAESVGVPSLRLKLLAY